VRLLDAAELAEHAADDQLSSREIDVIRLIGEGNANKQIADKLSIGETTVKNHISNILSKLGANDRAHAVTIALQRGIIELDVRQRWDSKILLLTLSICFQDH
jgi:DNA-binding NarL/FixJ family response regulator